jgi:Uncharacterised nucleotidyltransferase
MSLSFRRKITSLLGAGEGTQGETILRSIRAHEWDRELGWLDRSGLALPFIAVIQQRSLMHALPPVILESLLQRLRDNHKRMSQMLNAFSRITCSFHAQNITYACVKGFSLIPDYLPTIAWRHQSDYDFLIAERDIESAEQILLRLGYRLIAKDSTGERRFATSGTEVKGRDAYLYPLQESHAAELHLYFWEAEEREIQLSFPIELLPQYLEAHEVGGISFSRLRPAYQLTYQLLHFFRHVSGTWARLLWLYEIAQFVSEHLAEGALWQEINALWRTDKKLKQICLLVLRLAVKIFSAPVPAAIQTEADDWEICQFWTAHFSESCLYADLPGNKGALLFLQPFFEDEIRYRHYRATRLFPIDQGHVLDERLSPAINRSLKYRIRNTLYQASRLIYHLYTNLHYFVLKVQWNGRMVLLMFR